MKTLRNLGWFLVGVGLAVWIGIATAAERRLPVEEATPTCVFWAQTYAQITMKRDAGFSRSELHALVTHLQGEGRINAETGKALHKAIDWVYKYPHLTPAQVSDTVFKQCMKDMTQQSI